MPAPAEQYRPRVVVKFSDRLGIPYDRSANDEIVRRRLDPQGILAAEFPGAAFEPLLRSKPPDEILRLVARARDRDSTYTPPDFLTYFAVSVPEGGDPQRLREVLASLPTVSIAYVESPPGEPPLVTPGDDPLSANQGYLDAAPVGINARYAWTQPGGDGAGQALVDLERGWTLAHEDLQAHNITVVSGVNKEYFFHGTAVLGIMAAVDNTVGVVGIVPAINSVRCVSEWRTDGSFSTADAIVDALDVLKAGQVLLLEAQAADYSGYRNVPVEIEPAVFDLISLATASGIVVIEAAGNGAQDLDRVQDPDRGFVLNREHRDFIDSGAIIVGAATSTARARTETSNFGSRVDCFAWGENVTTTFTDANGTALRDYTHVAGGTSAAAAIVAGAGVAVQGAREAQPNMRFDPATLRALLSDPANTASQKPQVDRIGVMPDLKVLIDVLITSPSPLLSVVQGRGHGIGRRRMH
jgi:hypothetical protein